MTRAIRKVAPIGISTQSVCRLMKTTPFLLAALFIAPACLWPQAPDTILYNGKIFTSNTDQLRVEALAIRGERISAAGSNDSVRQLAGAQTRIIDLGGRTVVPGFNDAHWHQPLRVNL